CCLLNNRTISNAFKNCSKSTYGSNKVVLVPLSGEAGFDRGQRGEEDVAHALQAARTDRVEGVSGRVPRLVLEIDDVDGRNAGLDERQVVILDRRRAGDERRLELL